MNQFPIGLKKAATLCILKNHNSFLLLKRLKDPNKDMYTPIGGKLDPFESPLQGALRETWEEAGIKLENMQFCGILTETSPLSYNWINYVFLAEIEKMAPPYCNEGTLEWISFDNLLDIPTPKTDWHIYRMILDGKKFVLNAEFNENLELIRMYEELEGLQLV